MEGFRSTSHSHDSNEKPSAQEVGNHRNRLRSYSASYASSSEQGNGPMDVAAAGEGWKFKKGNSTNSKGWIFNDAELQRKKRVAGYKAYGVEGKMKGSVKKSFKWLRERYALVVHGHM